MNRQEAHAALDAVLDALEAAERLNDAGARVEAESGVLAEWQALAAAVIGDTIARRMGGAALGYARDDARRFSPMIANAVKAPMPPEKLRDPETAKRARSFIARFLLDHEPLLPPGLARQAAAALWSLNLGESLPGLLAPYRVKGAPKASGRKFFAEITTLSRIYYHAGYWGMSLEAAFDALGEKLDGPNKAKWSQLESVRKRYILAEHLRDTQSIGQRHRAAGRLYDPPIGAAHDLEQIARLTEMRPPIA